MGFATHIVVTIAVTVGVAVLACSIMRPGNRELPLRYRHRVGYVFADAPVSPVHLVSVARYAVGWRLVGSEASIYLSLRLVGKASSQRLATRSD